MKTSGEKENHKYFLLKTSFVGFFVFFLLVDQWVDRSLTLNVLIQVLFDPRLMFVCLILVPWNKVERFAQRTGQLRLAQSLALITIGILAIANIVMFVSSGLAFSEHRNMENQLSQDKRLYDDLENKYAHMLRTGDSRPEIYQREVVISLFDWVSETIPGEYPWILITPNPSKLDFQVWEPGDPHIYETNREQENIDWEQKSTDWGQDGQYGFLLLDEEGHTLVSSEFFGNGWPILISTEVLTNPQLKLTLEQHVVIPFPSQWSNTGEQLDLVVWLEGIDSRPPNFDPSQTISQPPQIWRVMEFEDNGNGILDVSVSLSSMIVNEESIKILRTEMNEISQFLSLNESIAPDEQALEERAPLLLISGLLLFFTVPGTVYHSWRAVRTVRNWKVIQQQHWRTLQKKLESLQAGLVLGGNRVNGYPWEDLEYFVDWNKPVVIRIADTKYRQLLGAIYQAAPLGTTFTVQEGEAEDRFIKETGRFAIDFSQPLEVGNDA